MFRSECCQLDARVHIFRGIRDFNPLTTGPDYIWFINNVHPPEVMDRVSETQLPIKKTFN